MLTNNTKVNIKNIGKNTFMKIPKIIHQVWVGNLPMPKKWMRTWKEKNTDWKYILWGNDRIFNRKWINQKHIDFYKNKKTWWGIADIVRYEILYEFGGYMPGTDSECLNSIDNLFNENGFDCYTVYSNERIRKGHIAPIMACTKNNPLLKAMIEDLANRKRIGLYPVWREVGNLFTRQMTEKTEYKNIKIYPSYYFIPEHFMGDKYTGKGKIYARHHWGTTLKKYNEGV